MTFQRQIVWAAVPFTPALPLEIEIGNSWKVYDTRADLVADTRVGRLAGTLVFAVPGKIRPVLVISEPSQAHGELTALRLTNVSRLLAAGRITDDDLSAVREQRFSGLFHLKPRTVGAMARPGEVYAANTEALVRLDPSAITTRSVGEVDRAEFQILCQRIVADLGLDISALVAEKAAQLRS